MKDLQLLSCYTKRRYTKPIHHLAAGWDSSLWEDFPEEELDDDETAFDAESGDLTGDLVQADK